MECAAPAPVTAPLAAAVLELLCAPAVHAHPQPFVRRSALVAASQVGVYSGFTRCRLLTVPASCATSAACFRLRQVG